MGGAGSGRWRWHDKKTTVEECRTLDAFGLARDGVISTTPGVGMIWWSDASTGERTASLGFSRSVLGGRVILTLAYTTGRPGGAKHDVSVPVTLQTTRLGVRGVRWWFTCPLVIDIRRCGRRVGKLYLPPASRFFGCRHCHDLTYRRCQESHRYDRLFSRLAARRRRRREMC